MWFVEVFFYSVGCLFYWNAVCSWFSFFLKFIFNWRIIALQCCVGFYQTSTWISLSWYVYLVSAALLNSRFRRFSDVWGQILRDCVCKPSCHLQIGTGLFLLSVWLLFPFLAFLHWVEFPVLCCTRVVRMDILVLSNRGNECNVHFFHLSLCVVMFAVFFLKMLII